MNQASPSTLSVHQVCACDYMGLIQATGILWFGGYRVGFHALGQVGGVVEQP